MQIILFVGDRQFDGAKRWQVSHCPVDTQLICGADRSEQACSG